MNKVISWLKNISLRQILTGLMAGLLLFGSTACGNTPSVMANTSDQVREEIPSRNVTSTYEGGMNQYPDTDPRQGSASRLESQGKDLVKNAQQNVKKSYENPASAAKRAVKDLPENAAEVGENAKRSAAKLGDRTKEAAENASEAVQSKVSRDIDRAQQAASNTAESVKSKVNRDIDRTERAMENAADAVK